MKLIYLALRNLSRNRRRTVITGLAIAFGVAALVILQGMVNGAVQNIIEKNVLSRIAPVQVWKAGYLGADDPLKLSLPQDPSVMERLRSVPEVTAVAPRLDFDGMISNGSEATMVSATAFDPALEYQVCPKRATYFAKGSRALTNEDPAGTLVGKTIAESLGLQVGSTAILQAAGKDGKVNALDIGVVGLLPSMHPAESKRIANVELALAQELLAMPGRITGYVVGIEEVSHADDVAERLRATLGSGYQVTTWKDVDQLGLNRSRMFRAIFGFIAFILFLLVASGITNTVMMSVHERVREIGTLMALGVRRRQIRLLFLFEAALLALASGAIGGAVGASCTWLFARHGISASAPGGDSFILFPQVSSGFVVGIVMATLAGTVMSALYPANRASRLRPVEALRSV